MPFMPNEPFFIGMGVVFNILGLFFSETSCSEEQMLKHWCFGWLETRNVAMGRLF